MRKVTFEILRIYAGWFDVRFVSGDAGCSFGASDAWCNNSPKYFLQMLAELLEGISAAGYVVFDEEPGTYIVCIEKGEAVKLTVSYSKLCDNEWKGIQVHGSLTQKELEKSITIDKELFCVEDFDLWDFADSVVKAFERYASKHGRDKYEGNWMDFPLEELERLRESLKD